MGVTIHYRGSMDELGRVQDLQRELADIAKSMGWEHSLLDDDWTVPPDAVLVHERGCARIEGHLGLKGASLQPGDGGEALTFFVDAAGRLRSIMDVILQCEGRSAPDGAWVSVKTQFLSPEAHVWIVGLLKYLQKRYFSNLEVHDEGEFWETGERATLEAKMRLINERLSELTTGLRARSFGNLTGLSAEEIASRIEDFLRERRGEL